MARDSSLRSFFRTEVGDADTAKAPDTEPENVEFVPPAHPPTPGGPIPVPYPIIDPSSEEQEVQQLVKSEFGRGAPNDVAEPANSHPDPEHSLDIEPVLEDFPDPVSDALDDPFEIAEPHHAPVFEEGIGIELDVEEPAEDLDID